MHRDLIKPFRGNIDAHLCALSLIAGETPVRLLEEWLNRQYPLPPLTPKLDEITMSEPDQCRS